MIYKIKELCKEHADIGCEPCPLFDKTADMCSLHSDIPKDWDVKRIKEVVEDDQTT